MSQDRLEDLRRKAEELLAAREFHIESLKRTELESLAHQLAVHQIELKIQNEELQRTRAEVEAVGDRYLYLYDFAPVAYFTLDEHNRIVEANLTGCQLLKVERSEILKKSFTKFITPEESEKFYLRRRKALESGARQTGELEMQKKDGASFYAQIEFLKAAGERLSLAVMDVTERKQRESRQLLVSEILGILNDSSKTENIINSILALIQKETGFEAVGIRLKSGDDYTYFAQSGFTHDFLATENTLTERDKNGGVCRDKDGSISLECTCGLVLSGKTDPANPLFTPGGSAWTNDSLSILNIPAEQDPRRHPRNRCIHEGFRSIALIPIRADRDIVGLLQLNDRRKDCFTLERVQFFEGLTASIGVALMRKQAEEALQRYSSELEAVNKELEAFSSSVSHDLRAPLRTLDGFSQAVLQDYGNKLDETGRDYLNRIRTASQTMAQLIDDMLKLSRITRSDMNLGEVKLSDLAMSIANELKTAQPDRELELIIQPDVKVNGDKRLLEIALRNLLENSWKYTGKRPRSRIEFGVKNHDSKPVYFVADNGVGFDMKYADKLFQPFRRMHSDREFQGTGIGLATTQRVILRHGGHIWAESEVGKGTVFYFTLD
jgi:PAS domain S-box-containing protein